MRRSGFLTPSAHEKTAASKSGARRVSPAAAQPLDRRQRVRSWLEAGAVKRDSLLDCRGEALAGRFKLEGEADAAQARFEGAGRPGVEVVGPCARSTR
jgi:hypothetical protein